MGKKYVNTDFINRRLSGIRLENKQYENCSFTNCKFINVVDDGNKYTNCSFVNCTFKNCIIGYNQSLFEQCNFNQIKLTNTTFICPFFKNSTFNGALKSIDFNASRFEDVVFEGELSDVWFRGGFPSKAIAKILGPASQNLMKNVNFVNARLNHLVFSDNCNLDTVSIPSQKNYFLVQNWAGFLDFLDDTADNADDKLRPNIKLFCASRKIHSAKQETYILNINDFEEEFDYLFADFLYSMLNKWLLGGHK